MTLEEVIKEQDKKIIALSQALHEERCLNMTYKECLRDGFNLHLKLMELDSFYPNQRTFRGVLLETNKWSEPKYFSKEWIMTDEIKDKFSSSFVEKLPWEECIVRLLIDYPDKLVIENGLMPKV